MHLGILAQLEGNADLLAEVVIALGYIGAEVPGDWRHEVLDGWNDFAAVPARGGVDGYHEYVVLGWAAAVLGQGPVFDRPIPDGA